MLLLAISRGTAGRRRSSPRPYQVLRTRRAELPAVRERRAPPARPRTHARVRQPCPHTRGGSARSSAPCVTAPTPPPPRARGNATQRGPGAGAALIHPPASLDWGIGAASAFPLETIPAPLGDRGAVITEQAAAGAERGRAAPGPPASPLLHRGLRGAGNNGGGGCAVPRLFTGEPHARHRAGRARGSMSAFLCPPPERLSGGGRRRGPGRGGRQEGRGSAQPAFSCARRERGKAGGAQGPRRGLRGGDAGLSPPDGGERPRRVTERAERCGEGSGGKSEG